MQNSVLMGCSWELRAEGLPAARPRGAALCRGDTVGSPLLAAPAGRTARRNTRELESRPFLQPQAVNPLKAPTHQGKGWQSAGTSSLSPASPVLGQHPGAVMAPWGRGDPWRGRECGASAAREVCCGKQLAGKAGANETAAWQESWQQGSVPPSMRGFSPACGLLTHPQPFANPKCRVGKPSPLQHPIL